MSIVILASLYSPRMVEIRRAHTYSMLSRCTNANRVRLFTSARRPPPAGRREQSNITQSNMKPRRPTRSSPRASTPLSKGETELVSAGDSLTDPGTGLSETKNEPKTVLVLQYSKLIPDATYISLAPYIRWTSLSTMTGSNRSTRLEM